MNIRFPRPLRSLACMAVLFGAFALPAAAQEGPKLYVFTSGSLGGFPKAALQIGGQGNIDWAPVSFYVIKHPKGNVMFDCGNNDKTITDADGWWGPLAKGFGLKMTKDDAIPAQLAKIGLKPDDVKYLVVGHLLGIPGEAAFALSLIARVRELALGVPGLVAWQLIEGQRLLRARPLSAKQ